ncbi:MAG: hypothetical protein HFP77_02135 [Methylococcales symbiont of Iophon sp. n. MRB-2018]|nr:MAG: hypothetical protein HFP77_02135 [Methylococcales symbiont of Iophon sp. n. MRB-2018]KAF3979787.1 MAG: hypothetical protein HFP76_05555 [Methylococcales symbiont of Iophon sp. n. MRB-2018]
MSLKSAILFKNAVSVGLFVKFLALSQALKTIQTMGFIKNNPIGSKTLP